MAKRSKIKPLPARTLEQVVEAFPSYRQSLLGTVDNCALSARFDLQGYNFNNAAQARGIIFHRYAAEVLNTLRATGNSTIPVAEALEILYEVSRQRDVPAEDVVVVPARERLMLRKCAIALVFDLRERKPRVFNMKRLIATERRLSAVVTYDHPEFGTVERLITGQPDALLADPDPGGDPDKAGAVVLDWKTTRSAPPKGKTSADYTADDMGDDAHISYEGYWQQRFYALLVLRSFPSVQFVTLREFYVLPGEARPATIHRSHLEHIEREIADAVELLDRALEGGQGSALWAPSPGKHCAYCRRPQSCPIEADARIREGGIVSQAEAERVGAEFVLTTQVRDNHREALKNWHDKTSKPIPVRSSKGRAEIRWTTNKGGGRVFKLTVPEASDRAPDVDLAAAFDGAAR
jgi:hypothetical protein